MISVSAFLCYQGTEKIPLLSKTITSSSWALADKVAVNRVDLKLGQSITYALQTRFTVSKITEYGLSFGAMWWVIRQFDFKKPVKENALWM